MLSTEEIRTLLNDLESDRVERTISLTNTDKFGQAICAFANDLPNNRKPGYLFLGVNDDGSIHPINVTDENTQTPAVQSFLNALTGQNLTYELEVHPLSRPQPFSGILTGGNLSMLYSLVGSPSDINTEDKVLFIEDLDEYLYHIDRMVLNLKRSGKLSGIKALLVGHLSDMHDNTIPFGKTAEEIVADECRDFAFPLVFNVPAGHLPDNRAFRMGCKIEGFFKDNKFIINSLNHD